MILNIKSIAMQLPRNSSLAQSLLSYPNSTSSPLPNNKPTDNLVINILIPLILMHLLYTKSAQITLPTPLY